jgi:acyl carrier protein
MNDPISSVVRSFIVDNFLYGDTSHPLGDETSFIETDLVDSTGILELVAFVEDQFGLTVADAEIIPANLDSIARIAAFVVAKGAPQSNVA